MARFHRRGLARAPDAGGTRIAAQASTKKSRRVDRARRELTWRMWRMRRLGKLRENLEPDPARVPMPSFTGGPSVRLHREFRCRNRQESLDGAISEASPLWGSPARARTAHRTFSPPSRSSRSRQRCNSHEPGIAHDRRVHRSGHRSLPRPGRQGEAARGRGVNDGTRTGAGCNVRWR